MKIRSTRGEVATASLILYVVLGLALTQLVPNWRVTHWFQKGPPTSQLSKSQDELDKALADAAKAQADLLVVLEAERTKTKEQVGYSQQMVAGASASLKRAPDSPQVALATSFLDRATIGLVKAIGELSVDRQNEILAIVDNALSGMQAKVDSANAALAVKDKQLEVLTAQKIALEKQVPELQADLDKKTKVVVDTQAVVAKNTAEIVAYAEKAAAKEKEAGSLGAFISRLIKALIVLAVIAAILGGLYVWRRFRSVSTKTLGTIIGDIRSGVAPTQAFDTNLAPSLHSAVSKQSILTVAANKTTP